MPHPQAPPQIFDRQMLKLRRDRSAETFKQTDFLHRRVFEDIVDRLETVSRPFDTSLFYGCGHLTDLLTEPCGVGTVIHADISAKRCASCKPSICADEEKLPFKKHSLDLVVSLLSLHQSNDFIGALSQIKNSLKPDGLFIAALFGEGTLSSLRHSLYAAETSIFGGVSPRLAPFANVRDLGDAMQRAGFAMPVTDVDLIDVQYQNPLSLFKDIKNIGETSTLVNRGPALSRRILTEVANDLTGTNKPITFNIVYLTGWAPDKNQPKPLKPGSARASLADAIIKSGDFS